MFKTSLQVRNYIRQTPDILLNLYLVNSYRGLSNQDIAAIESLQNLGRPFQICINKIDKCNAEEIASLLMEISSVTSSLRLCHKAIHLVSAKYGNGVHELNGHLSLLIMNYKPQLKMVESIKEKKIVTNNNYF